jgi:hypothetical protein
MMIVIATQDYENYAAHQGFTGDFYWKAKGGSEFKIVGVPQNVDIDEVVEMARDGIERNDEYFQTNILGYDLKSDDYLSWFEKSQLDYEGSITFKEPVIEYSDLVARYTDPMEYAEMCADNDATYYGA